MAKSKAPGEQGLQEERTRVTLFLPAHKHDDMRAVRLVKDYLQKQSKSKTCRVTGFTSSVYPLSPFLGVWWSPRRNKWVPEKITLLIIDYAEVFGDPKLEQGLRRLKEAVHQSYVRVGRTQDEIWVIAQAAIRFA